VGVAAASGAGVEVRLAVEAAVGLAVDVEVGLAFEVEAAVVELDVAAPPTAVESPTGGSGAASDAGAGSAARSGFTVNTY
jgi:hypothetical protein